MNPAIITLSGHGAAIAQSLLTTFPQATIFVHQSVANRHGESQFASILDLTQSIFHSHHPLIFIAPCGVVVRAIAPMIDHKLRDPAVVVVDTGARWAISLLSGHEGGANHVALAVSNALHAEPVITTTTEADKSLIIGIGCRRGTSAASIMAAIHHALTLTQSSINHVRYVASAEIKSTEPGLLDACATLNLPIRFIAHEAIRACSRNFTHSSFVHQQVSLPAVAEPTALLAGTRTSCILKKTIIHGITISIAKENSWS